VATKTIVEKVCDLTGEPAEETVEFGLGDKAYRIDLTKNHADGLREILADYIKVAQPIGKVQVAGSNGRKARASSGVKQSREQTQAIRSWARQNGYQVGDKGRIPLKVQEAFDQTHQAPAQPPAAAYEPSRGWS
jgi:Lsr2